MIPTIQFREQYGEVISRLIEEFFYGLIYKPLLDVINKHLPEAPVKLSAADPPEDEMPLMRKIQDGVITYDGQSFAGTFDSRSSKAIRKMGGVWDPIKKVFRMGPGKLTDNLKVAVRASQDRSEKIHAGLTNELGNIESRIDPAVEELDLSHGIDRVIAGLQSQTINAMKAIGVPYTLTHGMRERLKADYTDNMKLYIKGWAEEHVKTLRDKVAANAMAGYRFPRLMDTLKTDYGVSAKGKAQFLARQETSLFMSKFRRERFKDAGVNFYVWQTVGDRKVRVDHQALNKRVFQFGDPPVVDVATGRKAEPGEDFNCLPADSRIDFVHGVEKCFRRWYSGHLTTIVTASGKTVRATPNHPVLTTRGWKAIGLLDESDYVIDLSKELANAPIADGDQRIPMISEIFEAHRETGASHTFMGETNQFHGDGSNCEIDVIDTAGLLRISRQIDGLELVKQFALAFANNLTSALSGFRQNLLSFVFGDVFAGGMGSGSQLLAIGESHATHANGIGFRNATNGYAGFEEPPTDYNTFKVGSFRNGKFALAGEIRIDDGFWVKLQSVARVAADRVAGIRNDLFNGHVFNLQTDLGYYTSTGVIVSNCRCVARPITKPVHKIGTEWKIIDE